MNIIINYNFRNPVQIQCWADFVRSGDSFPALEKGSTYLHLRDGQSPRLQGGEGVRDKSVNISSACP